jgi:plastocyanin
MRKLALSLALASVTLAAACGGDSPEPTAASSETAQAEPSASPEGGQATVLTGTVGTMEDPDAYVITLTDGSGQPVTTLPAGQYQIQVSDLSAIHNFHLKGGTVDETTTVPEITDTTFDVTFEPGDYTFVCDPHAKKMVGQFSVT